MDCSAISEEEEEEEEEEKKEKEEPNISIEIYRFTLLLGFTASN